MHLRCRWSCVGNFWKSPWSINISLTALAPLPRETMTFKDHLSSVVWTTPLFEFDINHETMDHLKKFYFSLQKDTSQQMARNYLIRIHQKGNDSKRTIHSWATIFWWWQSSFHIHMKQCPNKCSFALMAVTIKYLNKEESKMQDEILKNE